MPPRLLLLLACASLAGCTCGSLPGRQALRPPELAGTWYPDDEEALAKALDEAMAGVEPLEEPVRALVVPHAGLAYTAKTAGRGWGALRNQRYDRVVLVAQAHVRRYAGVFLPAEGGCRTPLGPLLLDEDAVAQLERFPGFERRAAPFDDENSVEMLLPWIARLWPQARVVPVLLGRIDDDRVAQVSEALQALLDDRTLLVVSSDFAHAGDRFNNRLVPPKLTGRAAEAAFAEVQRPALEALLAGDEAALLQRNREAKLMLCSRSALRVLIRLLGPEPQPVLSGLGSSIPIDFSQRDGEAIGYVVAAFGGRWPSVPALDARTRETLARIARQSLEAAAAGREPPPLAAVPPRLEAPGGAFVTLSRDGRVRACVGRVFEDRLAEAVRRAAALAVREELRPAPVTSEELAGLEAEVSVLGAMTALEDPLDFEPGRHGLLLTRGEATGLLLPQVATQDGLDREGFLRALAVKAGLAPDDWRGAELERFGVEVIPVPRAPSLDASAGPPAR